MANCVAGRKGLTVHPDRVAQRRPQPARANEQAQSRKPPGIRGKLRDLLDRSSAHFRAFSSDNSNGLVANENLSTTHILGCADVICSSGRGKRPSRRRQNWRVENDKAARSVGGSHSLRNQRLPRPVRTGGGRSVTPSFTQLVSLGRLLLFG